MEHCSEKQHAQKLNQLDFTRVVQVYHTLDGVGGRFTHLTGEIGDAMDSSRQRQQPCEHCINWSSWHGAVNAREKASYTELPVLANATDRGDGAFGDGPRHCWPEEDVEADHKPRRRSGPALSKCRVHEMKLELWNTTSGSTTCVLESA